MKVLIKQFKESGLAPEIMLRTQPSCPFPKLQKLQKYYVHFFFKLALQNGLEKGLFTATIGMPLWADGNCDVTESYLE